MKHRRLQAAQQEESLGRVIERPDGFYWQAKRGEEECGPFASIAEAEADMLAGGDAEYEPVESLHEAESEIGIAEWIDPDTGEPAEESGPRLEEH